MIDPYQILGIPRTASLDEAKQAYRRMARKYHPDVSKEPNAEERFKEVQAAWEAIKNPRPSETPWGARAGRGSARSWTSADYEEILRGFSGGWGSGFGEHSFGRVMNINVTLEQAYTGAIHNIGGARIHLPPGVRTGTRVQVSNDLTVVVTVLPHNRFKRKDDDLLVNLHVGIAEAILGCNARIHSVAGNTLEVKIPGGIQNGQTVRLRGQGMPNPANSSHRGDLFLQVFVDTPDPKTLNEEQRQFLEANFNYQRNLDA